MRSMVRWYPGVSVCNLKIHKNQYFIYTTGRRGHNSCFCLIGKPLLLQAFALADFSSVHLRLSICCLTQW